MVGSACAIFDINIDYLILIIRLIFSLKKPELGKSEFYLGEKILLWKVSYRSNDEILLEWQSGIFHGLTSVVGK